MDGYIAKPVHAHELFETIETVLTHAEKAAAEHTSQPTHS